MSKEAFIYKKFRASSIEVIDQANNIIDEYFEQGYSLTLRQLYYQFVSRNLIKNSLKDYKRLGSILSDARLAGLVDWLSIEDRTRNLNSPPTWDKASDIISSCEDQYRCDKWDNQKYRLEVWIEKEALIGVIAGICNEWDVPFYACKGYNSQSEQYKAGKRLSRYMDNGQKPIVIHLGDHDPSGIDMTADNDFRLNLFSHNESVTVKRIALNMHQIKEYNPPPNYAKESDTRYTRYCLTFNTTDCWELDALEPSVISNLVKDEIDHYRDDKKWKKKVTYENKVKKTIGKIVKDLKDDNK